MPAERHRRPELGFSAHTEPRVPVESAVPMAGDVYRAPPEVAATLPLRVGDRVLWISDSGPEPGTVGWIGKLPPEDGGRDWMVGVEFDNPVGSGNGCYRGHRLFGAKMDHASIVPINGLMRAEDFLAPAAAVPALPAAPVTRSVGSTGRPAEHASSNSAYSGGHFLELHTSDEDEPEPHPHTHPHPASRSTRDAREPDLRSTRDGRDPDLRPARDGRDPDLRPARDARDPDLRPTRDARDCRDGRVGRVRGHEFGDDLRHLTPFHRLAYEQLTASGGATLPGATSPGQIVDECDRYMQPKKGMTETTGRRRPGLPLSDLSNWQTVPARRREKTSAASPSGDPPPVPPQPYDPGPAADPDLSVGSAVEVDIQGVPQYGVIRWVGSVRGDARRRLMAGIEMEEDDAANGGDGTFHGVRYFKCQPGKALFVPLSDCCRDRRFLDMTHESSDSNAFGSVECPVISGNVPPISVTSSEELRKLCGKLKGIQGHLNSCYLDATLFSMFAFTPVLDCLLLRPRRSGDIPEYAEVQRLLKEEIVNPLRSNMYVRADRVMKLRQMLETLSSVRGLTSEEKDPEEFLQSLLAQILHADPFLRYSSGQESYLYQLIVERDERLVLPSVQQLFDQSFLAGDIKLKEIPSCLIVQMPRFGKDYKMYSRIMPSMVLDVTDVIENSPRQCFVCGRLAEWECKECFDQASLCLTTTAFCSKCNATSHSHQARASHRPRQPLRVPSQFTELRDHAHIPRCYLELFAVVCIHTSHYVAFTRTGLGPDAGWVFFDSMADRKGEAHGYNIPEVAPVPELPRWLTEEGRRSLLTVTDDKRLPEHARRLLCDAYLCFYQSKDVMMYR